VSDEAVRRVRDRAGGVRSGCRVALLCATIAVAARAGAETYYVRQRAGNDANDGRSPATAWRHVGKLTAAMGPGDVAYVGPGLYRERIQVVRSGTADRPITFVADDKGRHTGDPAGIVMLAGSEPVDEAIFAPTDAPGVFTAHFPAWTVRGVVEMDGPQARYVHTSLLREHLVDGVSPVEVVRRLRSSWFHDDATRTLHLHTSDDRPPTAHELELIRRGHGIVARGTEHVTVVGFTFRHMQDAGVAFFAGADHGTVIGTVSYGSRQGIRVHGSTDALVYASVLFRNESSGAYFAAGSKRGRAVGVTSYQNRQGLRWSGDSTDAAVVDNALFDNRERGLALENADGAVVRGNRLVGNAVSQLHVLQSRYASDENCFDGPPGQLVADFTPFGHADRYETLAAYTTARGQDRRSRQGRCGTLPARIDVRRLHARTRVPTAEEARPKGVREWIRALVDEARAR
jgi:hypothetical protein